jgi:hypothetical protein
MLNEVHNFDRHANRAVDFDPRNPEHLEAFEMLCLGIKGKLQMHPTLRFYLNPPFQNLRTQMLHMVAECYIQDSRVKQLLEK